MVCKDCGGNVKSDFKYCPYCGARIISDFHDHFENLESSYVIDAAFEDDPPPPEIEVPYPDENDYGEETETVFDLPQLHGAREQEPFYDGGEETSPYFVYQPEIQPPHINMPPPIESLSEQEMRETAPQHGKPPKSGVGIGMKLALILILLLAAATVSILGYRIFATKLPFGMDGLLSVLCLCRQLRIV